MVRGLFKAAFGTATLGCPVRGRDRDPGGGRPQRGYCSIQAEGTEAWAPAEEGTTEPRRGHRLLTATWAGRKEACGHLLSPTLLPHSFQHFLPRVSQSCLHHLKPLEAPPLSLEERLTQNRGCHFPSERGPGGGRRMLIRRETEEGGDRAAICSGALAGRGAWGGEMQWVTPILFKV